MPEEKEVLTKTKYRIIFFPVACFTVVGAVAVLTIFGVRVYRRAGNHHSFLGVTWTSND